MRNAIRFSIRYGGTVWLLFMVYANAHWSVGVVLTLLTINTEIQNRINRTYRELFKTMIVPLELLLGRRFTDNDNST